MSTIKFQSRLVEVGILDEKEKGVSQLVFFHVEKKTDEFNRVVQAEQFFPVNYFSKTKTDGRFFLKEQVGKLFNVKAWVQDRKYENSKNQVAFFVGLNLANSRQV